MKNKKYMNLILAVLIIVFVTSAVRIISIQSMYSKDTSEYQEMQKKLQSASSIESINSSQNSEFDVLSEIKQTEQNEKLKLLKEENEDFLGWLSIEGTNINYPVMASPHNPELYLRKNFKKEYSLSGTPFTADGISDDCDNLLVHGHNMKNGTMFSDLLKYMDESYCKEHSKITFETPEKIYTYQIIGVFPTEITAESGRTKFLYYNYSGDLSEELFDEYIENVMAESLYDTGETAQYGEQLLTLSTCAYHANNGRFVVVAHQILDYWFVNDVLQN